MRAKPNQVYRTGSRGQMRPSKSRRLAAILAAALQVCAQPTQEASAPPSASLSNVDDANPASCSCATAVASWARRRVASPAPCRLGLRAVEGLRHKTWVTLAQDRQGVGPRCPVSCTASEAALRQAQSWRRLAAGCLQGYRQDTPRPPLVLAGGAAGRARAPARGRRGLVRLAATRAAGGKAGWRGLVRLAATNAAVGGRGKAAAGAVSRLPGTSSARHVRLKQHEQASSVVQDAPRLAKKRAQL